MTERFEALHCFALFLCYTDAATTYKYTSFKWAKIANTWYLFYLLNFPACSDAVESVSSLYNHVEEQAHVLVQRTNLSLEHLEYLLQLREFEGHFMQVH